MSDHALEEVPPESPPGGAEERFLTAFQNQHPEFTFTEIRKVLRHCALELVLERSSDELAAAVERRLRDAWQASHRVEASWSGMQGFRAQLLCTLQWHRA